VRFFTREWLSGELMDAACDAVPAAYRLHLASLQLPPEVLALAAVDLHDGLFLDVQHEPESAQLTLRLRCGDLQRGYCDQYIRYAGTVLDSASLAVLRDALQIPRDELLYDEVDRVGECFEHRFILSSHNEVCVTFAGVELVAHTVSNRWSE
jgi:hypothetical protein